MATEKLYYQDSFLTEFTARVLTCDRAAGGWQVTLDRTAFYPEGGGQSWDTGTLGETRVLEVREVGEEICHLCDGPLTVGSQVWGLIDWERRFPLMQQHAGEHTISGLVHRYLGWHNTGFHMGKEAMEVDFDGPISQQMMERIEGEANEAVWRDMPLRCWIPSPEELETLTYRTKRALPWPVRIVEIGDVDSCACCGLHVARTGQIGLIKILSCVKFKGGVRLELVCGSQAYGYLSRVFGQNKRVAQAFSTPLTQTAEGARQQLEALAAEKSRSAALEKELFATIAGGYAGDGNVVHIHPGLEPGAARALAQAIAARCGGTAAVLSRKGDITAFCLADESRETVRVGKALLEACQGRGGGKDGFFQGTLGTTPEQARDFLAEYPF